MKLLAKFNLIFVVIFGIGTVLAIWLAYQYLQRDAKRQVFEEARLMMESTLATRSYTTNQIKPLLARLQKHDTEFLPQTVPAYSATQVFNYLHKNNPDYSYKEATLNPTDLLDRASDWEADIINKFRNDPTQKEIVGERDSAVGRTLYYARPLRVTEESCLECHSTPNVAPPPMIRQYGPNNGFGWHLHDIIGAQVVSVPETLPIQLADRALKTLIAYLVIVAIIALVILDAVLIAMVIRPVTRLSRIADDISRGKIDSEDIPIKGRDEISVLASAFNRMQRSLSRAMKLLEAEEDGSEHL